MPARNMIPLCRSVRVPVLCSESCPYERLLGVTCECGQHICAKCFFDNAYMSFHREQGKMMASVLRSACPKCDTTLGFSFQDDCNIVGKLIDAAMAGRAELSLGAHMEFYTNTADYWVRREPFSRVVIRQQADGSKTLMLLF